MRGMLLAAGLGTRLSPLTDELPKPAVPVGFRPLAASAIDVFVRAGVSRIDANAFHLPDALEAALRPELPASIPFALHRETSLLGTAGGIRGAIGGEPAEDVLVMNGDVRFQPDVAALVAQHRRLGALATLVVRNHPSPRALGAVELDAEGRVQRIAGAPDARAAVVGEYVFTGVHLIAPAAFARLPERGCIVRDVYQPMIAAGLPIAAVIDDSPWADLGTIPAYFEANLALAGEDARVHPQAQVAEAAQVRRSIVGAGARVGERAVLDRCVVWPGAIVDEPLRDAIVTPRGVVRVAR